MSNLLKYIYEYRNLLGRMEMHKMHLDEEDRVRLQDLQRIFEWRANPEPATAPGAASDGSFPLAIRRRFARVGVSLPSMLKIGSRTVGVTVVNLGGGGLVVEPAPVGLRRGAIVVLKIAEPTLGREYHFPAQIAWRSDRLGGGSAMGLSFFGIPVELRFGSGRTPLPHEPKPYSLESSPTLPNGRPSM